MPEDFDTVYTVEIHLSKGWEVVGTYDKLEDALRRFKSELGVKDEPVRLTSPVSPTEHQQ